ncbi:MAG: hypothetical protein KTR21_13345 [Rhodobacteraceae bacterium]|nr:hypothetical protein [Paracoccaceae bacterium]
MKKFLINTAAIVAFAAAAPAMANDYNDALGALANDKVRAIAADPVVIAAVKAQNEKHAALVQDEIDAMDKAWRAEVGAADTPTITPVLEHEASEALAAARDESEGLFTEIFVMDDKGLNVAASDVTSDYWQGDEAKWQETFSKGPDAVHLSEVELDESTQSYQSQVSVAVVDPDSGDAIGAVTFGVNVEYLE